MSKRNRLYELLGGNYLSPKDKDTPQYKIDKENVKIDVIKELIPHMEESIKEFRPFIIEEIRRDLSKDIHEIIRSQHGLMIRNEAERLNSEAESLKRTVIAFTWAILANVSYVKGYLEAETNREHPAAESALDNLYALLKYLGEEVERREETQQSD